THQRTNMEEQSTYAQDIQRIQQIVDLLGQKDCDIDKMLELVNEATALIEKCQNKLVSTGIKINAALDKLNAMKDA
ncbi:MAG: exodeoxyribonuclease VII small subunit, partial [Proteobacteria bacterium]|nr:exodeoxyribonuclease VII small subunit [Pseudomonadota bacterium]